MAKISMHIEAGSTAEFHETLAGLLAGTADVHISGTHPAEPPLTQMTADEVRAKLQQPELAVETAQEQAEDDTKPFRGKNAEKVANDLISEVERGITIDMALYERLPKAQQERVDAAIKAATAPAEEEPQIRTNPEDRRNPDDEPEAAEAPAAEHVDPEKVRDQARAALSEIMAQPGAHKQAFALHLLTNVAFTEEERKTSEIKIKTAPVAGLQKMLAVIANKELLAKHEEEHSEKLNAGKKGA